MRNLISLIENAIEEENLNEISHISDFTDSDEQDAKRAGYKNLLDGATRVADFGELDLYAKIEEFGTAYIFVDMWGNPVGRAMVSHLADKFIRVGYVRLNDRYLRQGIGYQFYKYLLNKGYNIVSDTDHTSSSRGLWSKFAREGLVRSYDGHHMGDHVIDTTDYYTKTSFGQPLKLLVMTNESFLQEKTLLLPTDSGMNFVVDRNPSKSQYFKLLQNPDVELKGLVSGDDFYVWSAYHAHHGQIAHKLGLENPIRLIVQQNAILAHRAYWDTIRNNKHVQYLYNGNVPLDDEQ